MKVCITGGGNVYALNLAQHLNELGVEHFGIGRRGPKSKAFWQVDHDYRYIVLHLIDHIDQVMAFLDREQPDVIVNFAAQGESAASFGEHTDYFYQTNTLGLVRFAEALRKRKYLRRFIQAGTSECYGPTRKPAKETDPLQPTSPYAISKAAFDLHLQAMHRVHCFPMNVIRPSNAYCPGQQLHRIIPRAIVCALSGKKLPLQGGGLAQKSYMHATDLSRAIIGVIERGELGKVYNCGPQSPTFIVDVAEMAIKACGKNPRDVIEEVPARVGEDSVYWLDSSALYSDTEWMPKITLEQGLVEMVRWVRAHPEILSMDSTYKIAA